jgi:ABC-type cobalamin/Fe3+-siderophores transport system ATPase subunit
MTGLLNKNTLFVLYRLLQKSFEKALFSNKSTLLPIFAGILELPRNGALLVVKLRVEQYQAVQFVRTLSRVIGADTASEARSQQTASTSAGRFPDTGQCHADVVQDRRERQLLLTTLAVTMTTLIKPQARHASLSEPVSEACEVQLMCSRS